MIHRERFAPSPTGPLHLGHAFSALTAWRRAAGGLCLLRIEDIDQSRARPDWEAGIYRDLAWLGLSWPDPVLRQSEHLPRYRAALGRLWARGLVYPCICRRADIQAAAPHAPLGPDGPVYPGTCRRPTGSPASGPLPPASLALRLDMARAVAALGPLSYREETLGEVPLSRAHLVEAVGDVVLARRGMGTSYHLSVVLDDAHQGITHVTRGQDLAEATAIHVVLQALFGLPQPIYHHHRLILDETGKRLAKRHDSKAIAKFRDEGATPADIRAMVGL